MIGHQPVNDFGHVFPVWLTFFLDLQIFIEEFLFFFVGQLKTPEVKEAHFRIFPNLFYSLSLSIVFIVCWFVSVIENTNLTKKK